MLLFRPCRGGIPNSNPSRMYSENPCAPRKSSKSLNSDWLQSDNSPVIRNAVSGKFAGKAHGVSIYIPREQPSPLYKDLDFHSTGWYTTVKKIREP